MLLCLGDDILLEIVKHLDTDDIIRVCKAYTRVHFLVIAYKNTIFKDDFFTKLLCSLHDMILVKNDVSMLKRILELVIMFDDIACLRNYVREHELMEKSYSKLLANAPVRIPSKSKKAIKDIQYILAVNGCSITPLLFSYAVLVNDKKLVKYVLKMRKHILKDCIKSIEEYLPLTFYIKQQIAMLENNRKISPKQKTSVMTLLDLVCKKGAISTWRDKHGKFWTLNEYYNHFLVLP